MAAAWKPVKVAVLSPAVYIPWTRAQGTFYICCLPRRLRRYYRWMSSCKRPETRLRHFIFMFCALFHRDTRVQVYVFVLKRISLTLWASRNIVVMRVAMSPQEPPGTLTSLPRISWIKNDVNSLESLLPPSLCCRELTWATSASTPSMSRVIS